jgi:S1-C subfamily serine protease
LGVALAPPRHARRLRSAVGLPEIDGLLVHAVVPGSPAERAGVQRGDLIARAGGRAVTTVDDLFDALDAAADGTLTLGIVRGSEERDVDVALV